MKATKSPVKLLLIIVPVVLGTSAVIWSERTSQMVASTTGQHHDRYQCPMHPQIVQDHPGECPICHMRLEKVDEDDATVGASGSSTPPVLAPRHDKYQCPMHPQIVMDHPGDCPICHMHLVKVEEEESAPSANAQMGQPKVIKYRNPMDPTIFSDHAMKDSMGMDYIPVYADQMEGSGGTVAGKAGFTLSQERQQLIGVRTTGAVIEPLSLTVRMPGRVASGGRILAQLLEIDAGSLKPGMKAHLHGPNGATLAATVEGVDSELDSLTHTFGVTLRTSGSANWLRNGLFCEVLVDVDLGKHLAVPQEAVLDTGERQVLFVVDSRGHFDPRQVTLGLVGDDEVEVKQGLKAGEQVVTSANFLIDSESRFRAALKQF